MSYNWNEIYELLIKECEGEWKGRSDIFEIQDRGFLNGLVANENAGFDASFRLKLPDGATEKDKQKFCEYVLGYHGEDVIDFLLRQKDKD